MITRIAEIRFEHEGEYKVQLIYNHHSSVASYRVNIVRKVVRNSYFGQETSWADANEYEYETTNRRDAIENFLQVVRDLDLNENEVKYF